MRRTTLLSVLLTAAPVFYQLDHRERLGVDLNVPGLAGFSVTKSFEVRSRPADADAASVTLQGLAAGQRSSPQSAPNDERKQDENFRSTVRLAPTNNGGIL